MKFASSISRLLLGSCYVIPLVVAIKSAMSIMPVDERPRQTSLSLQISHQAQEQYGHHRVYARNGKICKVSTKRKGNHQLPQTSATPPASKMTAASPSEVSQAAPSASDGMSSAKMALKPSRNNKSDTLPGAVSSSTTSSSEGPSRTLYRSPPASPEGPSRTLYRSPPASPTAESQIRETVHNEPSPKTTPCTDDVSSARGAGTATSSPTHATPSREAVRSTEPCTDDVDKKHRGNAVDKQSSPPADPAHTIDRSKAAHHMSPEKSMEPSAKDVHTRHNIDQHPALTATSSPSSRPSDSGNAMKKAEEPCTESTSATKISTMMSISSGHDKKVMSSAHVQAHKSTSHPDRLTGEDPDCEESSRDVASEATPKDRGRERLSRTSSDSSSYPTPSVTWDNQGDVTASEHVDHKDGHLNPSEGDVWGVAVHHHPNEVDSTGDTDSSASADSTECAEIRIKAATRSKTNIHGPNVTSFGESDWDTVVRCLGHDYGVKGSTKWGAVAANNFQQGQRRDAGAASELQ